MLEFENLKKDCSSLTPGMRLREIMIVGCVMICIVGGWAAEISSIITAENFFDADGRITQVSQKSLFYYATHGISIFSGLLAGILCLLNGRLRVLSPGSRTAFFLLFVIAIIWAWITYTPQELCSNIVMGATGPFVWFIVFLVLAGTIDLVWIALKPLIGILAHITAILAFREILVSSFVRYNGFNKHTGYALLLIWLAGWNLLDAKHRQGLPLYSSFIPFFALLLTSIYSLSRSWTFLSILLLITFALLRMREQYRIRFAVKTLLAIALCLTIAAGTIHVFIPESMNARLGALNQRLMEDTRTSQYAAFFRVVPISSLVIGFGPKGTWYWPGFGEYQFFDNGYLWILFIGGIPTLLCYIIIVLRPAFRLAPHVPLGNDANPVALLLFWAMMLAGLSTYILPGTAFPNLIVLLLAGRCHRLLEERGRMPMPDQRALRIRQEAISIS